MESKPASEKPAPSCVAVELVNISFNLPRHDYQELKREAELLGICVPGLIGRRMTMTPLAGAYHLQPSKN